MFINFHGQGRELAENVGEIYQQSNLFFFNLKKSLSNGNEALMSCPYLQNNTRTFISLH